MWEVEDLAYGRTVVLLRCTTGVFLIIAGKVTLDDPDCRCCVKLLQKNELKGLKKAKIWFQFIAFQYLFSVIGYEACIEIYINIDWRPKFCLTGSVTIVIICLVKKMEISKETRIWIHVSSTMKLMQSLNVTPIVWLNCQYIFSSNECFIL